ncbi:MAG: transporter substrate-binding domain-containing protein [Opitutaceae bacterium]|nr:transporter substrate-binding domain-containing protein [Opitutaceae bacterium]
MPEAHAAHTYTVGVLDDNPPFSFRDTDGRIRGYAVDLLAAIERTRQIRFERRVGPTDEIHALFEQGELDMLQSFVPNEARRRRWAFSVPYLRMTGIIFARRGATRLATLDDLRGRTVAVHAGSVGARILEEEGLGASIRIVRSVEEAFHRVESGEVDATLASRLTGLESIRRLGLRQVVPVGESIPGYTVNYCFAMKPELEQLRAQIDETLLQLDRPDTSGISPRQQIYDAWFAFADPRRFDATQVAIAVSSGLAVALLIAVWAMLRQRRLRHEIARQADALRVSEEGYRTVFESTLHGLIVFERDPADPMRWLIVQINPAARHILGEPAGAAPRPSFADAFPADGALAFRLTGALAAGAPEPFEHDRSRPGQAAWVDVAVSRLGEHRRLVAIRDITDTKVAAERLRQSEARLRQNQKLEAIGTLASGVAHDFNNVLTAILGNIELMRLDLAADHVATTSLQEMRDAAERARFLVRQILAFSRRTEGRREVITVTPVVKEALRFVSATAPSTIEFRHHVADRTPPIEIDPTQLHQVLMNLCTNAVHALRERSGVVEVSEEAATIAAGTTGHPADLAPGDYLLLRVRDTGAGMPAEVLQRIFEPFFTTKPSGEGTGLGLAVVHGIVSGCGGAVDAVSEPGVGTTFSLYIPAARGKPVQAPSEEVNVPEGHGEFIILVDDEPAIIQTTTRLLERLGYTVAGFTHPAEALAEIRRHPRDVDLVITDLTMPAMSGIDLAGKIHALAPELPVILVSGFINEREMALARAGRVARILDKPITRAALAEAIATCLAGRSEPAP